MTRITVLGSVNLPKFVAVQCSLNLLAVKVLRMSFNILCILIPVLCIQFQGLLFYSEICKLPLDILFQHKEAFIKYSNSILIYKNRLHLLFTKPPSSVDIWSCYTITRMAQYHRPPFGIVWFFVMLVISADVVVFWCL